MYKMLLVSHGTRVIMHIAELWLKNIRLRTIQINSEFMGGQNIDRLQVKFYFPDKAILVEEKKRILRNNELAQYRKSILRLHAMFISYAIIPNITSTISSTR